MCLSALGSALAVSLSFPYQQGSPNDLCVPWPLHQVKKELLAQLTATGKEGKLKVRRGACSSGSAV